ncbi:hypothetical protein Vretifemale_20940 [Volvox reticuliferus]|uniref:Pherophorin domain-containing protein n=4 Tax=Volvox reticuliferus TaxID=1737510 RepID=A0A8J4D0R8_9CHLO|nr:hypothetical protein Vretifemale_20940 [Volvox reticuliferus]
MQMYVPGPTRLTLFSSRGLLPLALYLAVVLMTEIKQVDSARTSLFRGSQQASIMSVHKLQNNCVCSPYTLRYTGLVLQSSNGDAKHCFFVSFRGCDASSPCCEALLQDRVNSLYLYTAGSECLEQYPAISRVEVNGSRWEKWEERSNPSSPPGVIRGDHLAGIRIFDLAAEYSTLVGTTVCFTTTSTGQHCPGAGKMMCEHPAACRFAVTAESSDNSDDSETSVAVCPVLGRQHWRANLLEQGFATTNNSNSLSPPPAKRPMSSPRRSSPSPRRLQPPPPRHFRRPPPSPKPLRPPPEFPSSPSPSSDSKTSDAVADSTSHVCGAISLDSPVDTSGGLTYTIGKQISCEDAADWMAKNLTAVALDTGAQIATPFALETCLTAYMPQPAWPMLPTVLVCGSFTNVEEAAKIQDKVDRILAEWRYLILGWKLPVGYPPAPFCPPAGYTIRTSVWGDDERSPLGYLDIQCSSQPLYYPQPQHSAGGEFNVALPE